MALHRCALFHNHIIDIFIHFVTGDLLIFINRFIIHNLSVFKGIHPSQTQSLFSNSGLLYNTFVNPERHFLFNNVLSDIELGT